VILNLPTTPEKYYLVKCRTLASFIAIDVLIVLRNFPQKVDGSYMDGFCHTAT